MAGVTLLPMLFETTEVKLLLNGPTRRANSFCTLPIKSGTLANLPWLNSLVGRSVIDLPSTPGRKPGHEKLQKVGESA